MWILLPLGLLAIWSLTLGSNPAGLAPVQPTEAHLGEQWRIAPYDDARFRSDVQSFGTIVKTEIFKDVTWYTVRMTAPRTFMIGVTSGNIRSASRVA